MAYNSLLDLQLPGPHEIHLVGAHWQHVIALSHSGQRTHRHVFINDAIGGADNGLHVNVPTNEVYLGGTLIEPTNIDVDDFVLSFSDAAQNGGSISTNFFTTDTTGVDPLQIGKVRFEASNTVPLGIGIYGTMGTRYTVVTPSPGTTFYSTGAQMFTATTAEARAVWAGSYLAEASLQSDITFSVGGGQFIGTHSSENPTGTVWGIEAQANALDNGGTNGQVDMIGAVFGNVSVDAGKPVDSVMVISGSTGINPASIISGAAVFCSQAALPLPTATNVMAHLLLNDTPIGLQGAETTGYWGIYQNEPDLYGADQQWNHLGSLTGFGTVTQPTILLEANTGNTVDTPIFSWGNATQSNQLFASNATPEGAIIGDMGDLCTVDDGTGRLFVKVTGDAVNTGWNQVVTVSAEPASTIYTTDGTQLVVNNSQTVFTNLSGIDLDTTESNQQIPMVTDGVFSKLKVRVLINSLDVATTINWRLNGADHTGVITIPAATTGIFTDTTAMTVAEDDLVCLEITVPVQAVNPGGITIASIQSVFNSI